VLNEKSMPEPLTEELIAEAPPCNCLIDKQNDYSRNKKKVCSNCKPLAPKVKNSLADFE
jgi:hypothetical protein